MKTAYELLMSAPDEQIKRSQIALQAIAAGNWQDASFALENAANETDGEWSKNAQELADYCKRIGK
jgi:hypothetical protein